MEGGRRRGRRRVSRFYLCGSDNLSESAFGREGHRRGSRSGPGRRAGL